MNAFLEKVNKLETHFSKKKTEKNQQIYERNERQSNMKNWNGLFSEQAPKHQHFTRTPAETDLKTIYVYVLITKFNSNIWRAVLSSSMRATLFFASTFTLSKTFTINTVGFNETLSKLIYRHGRTQNPNHILSIAYELCTAKTKRTRDRNSKSQVRETRFRK